MNEQTNEVRKRLSEVCHRLVSIDAWHDGFGWYWNDSWARGEVKHADIIDKRGDISPRRLIRAVRKATGLDMRGLLRVENSGTDPDYWEIQDKGTGEPLYAVIVEWGEVFQAIDGEKP
jgi:hypothetical protein